MEKEFLTVFGNRYRIHACQGYNKSQVDLELPLCKEFSAIKLGCMKEIMSCSRKMARKISRTLPLPLQRRDVWVVINHPASTPSSAAAEMAREIARILKMERSEIKLRPLAFTSKSYYDFSPALKKEGLRKCLYYDGPNLKNKNVILVDDAAAACSALQTSSRLLLKNKLKSLHIFIYLRFKALNIEKEMGLTQFKLKGKQYLIDLINNEQNILTSRLLALILNMTPTEVRVLLSEIKRKRQKALMTELRSYSKNYQEFSWFKDF